MTKLTVKAFTQDQLVRSELAALHNSLSKRPVSDVWDAAGHQYVDLVMEGGGVLGIALVGYCHAMESVGIRFRSVAGTSAGAINALLMQAVAPASHKKSNALIREIANMPLASFQDGGSDAQRVVDALLSDQTLLIKLARLLPNLPELVAQQGINPGTVFYEWAKARLGYYHIQTLADLDAQLSRAPRGIHCRDCETGARRDLTWFARVALVASELGTARKVVLPRDAALFYDNPEATNPADFVRASMSVPYFFEPWRVQPIPRSPRAKKAWKHFKPRGPIPREAVFVDGGLLSNFPISEFHREDGEAPTMPTFGVKLGVDGGSVRQIDKLRNFTGALIDAMRFDADREFLFKNPDYRQLIAEIQTDGYHWLDFALSDEDKLGLFREGVIAARRFIGGFDWRRYRAMRTP